MVTMSWGRRATRVPASTSLVVVSIASGLVWPEWLSSPQIRAKRAPRRRSGCGHGTSAGFGVNTSRGLAFTRTPGTGTTRTSPARVSITSIVASARGASRAGTSCGLMTFQAGAFVTRTNVSGSVASAHTRSFVSSTSHSIGA